MKRGYPLIDKELEFIFDCFAKGLNDSEVSEGVPEADI